MSKKQTKPEKKAEVEKTKQVAEEENVYIVVDDQAHYLASYKSLQEVSDMFLHEAVVEDQLIEEICQYTIIYGKILKWKLGMKISIIE